MKHDYPTAVPGLPNEAYYVMLSILVIMLVIGLYMAFASPPKNDLEERAKLDRSILNLLDRSEATLTRHQIVEALRKQGFPEDQLDPKTLFRSPRIHEAVGQSISVDFRGVTRTRFYLRGVGYCEDCGEKVAITHYDEVVCSKCGGNAA